MERAPDAEGTEMVLEALEPRSLSADNHHRFRMRPTAVALQIPTGQVLSPVTGQLPVQPTIRDMSLYGQLHPPEGYPRQRHTPKNTTT
jgi:hypothetical protein